MDIIVNVKECHPKSLDKLMEDMKKLAEHNIVSTLQVNLELIAAYRTEKSH